MDDGEKLKRFYDALYRIATLKHAESCTSVDVPLLKCGCSEDPIEIAREVLEDTGDVLTAR
jgi:hypothetical protein